MVVLVELNDAQTGEWPKNKTRGKHFRTTEKITAHLSLISKIDRKKKINIIHT
jgi:hypothetical protein